MKKTIIKLKNIKKNFYLENGKEINVLKWLDLEIKDGEFIALMWESWSWKSTVLNVISCLFHASSGTYILDDEEISKLEDDEVLSFIRSKKMWFIFQQFHLIASYNAVENTSMPAIYLWTSREDRVKKAKKLLTKLGLKDKFNSRPWELSWWEQQRVAMARALINDPEILLADEPTWALDSKTSVEIMELMKDLNKKGLTIIMVTHSKEAAEYADKIIYLKDWKVVKK